MDCMVGAEEGGAAGFPVSSEGRFFVADQGEVANGDIGDQVVVDLEADFGGEREKGEGRH